ncbi:hypothetical protein DA102_035390 [Sinorhizobium meliloti]|nr:hypothetical protein DA102_035390 [Sinorhizobium meliloti]
MIVRNYAAPAAVTGLLTASAKAANLEDVWARSSLVVAITFMERLLAMFPTTAMLDAVGSRTTPTD